MKFSKLSQLFLVSSIGLLVATMMTACQLVSIDYVYVASSSGSTAGSSGQIDIFAADAASGALRKVVASVPSGGIAPIALAVSPNFLSLYAANQGTSNNVVHFTIADDGSLTQKDVATGFGTPVGIAVNQAGTLLFTAVQQGTGAALAVNPLATDGTVGAGTGAPSTLVVPGHSGDTIVPTGVTVLTNNKAVYVTVYDKSVYNPGGSTTPGDTANPGWVFGFGVGTGGALTALPGSPYEAGVAPRALTADPTSRFLYAVDFASSQMIGYTIMSDSSLVFFVAPPTKVGNQPDAITFDPRGKFVYVSNALDSTISAFVIDLSTGAATITANPVSGPVNPTDTEPVGLVVDPSLGRFLYTANYLGNSVSGFRLDPTSGVLTTTQNTPYPSGSNPTAIAAIPHGNHEVQSVTP